MLGSRAPESSILAKQAFMMHPWHDLSPGDRVPRDFYALGSNIKYELDKESGLIRMDRVPYSAVFYPANYGFIPQTLAEDRDPLDVLVLCQHPVAVDHHARAGYWSDDHDRLR